MISNPYTIKRGYSPMRCNIVKSATSRFTEWLIDEELIHRNPTRRIYIEANAMLAPHELTDDQRFILKSLVDYLEFTLSQVESLY